MRTDSRGTLAHGQFESIILVVTLDKGLVNTLIANGVVVVIVGDVVVLGALVVVIVVTLSKRLLVTVVANCILIVAVGDVAFLGVLQVPFLFFF